MTPFFTDSYDGVAKRLRPRRLAPRIRSGLIIAIGLLAISTRVSSQYGPDGSRTGLVRFSLDAKGSLGAISIALDTGGKGGGIIDQMWLLKPIGRLDGNVVPAQGRHGRVSSTDGRVDVIWDDGSQLLVVENRLAITAPAARSRVLSVAGIFYLRNRGFETNDGLLNTIFGRDWSRVFR